MALDVLRFLAAFSVMLFHFTGVDDDRWWGVGPQTIFPMPLARYGSYGVELFFIISGFVIMMSAWGRKPGDFAVSRVTRLYPAYWFAVLLAVAIFATTGYEAGYGPGAPGVYERMLPNLTMLQSGLDILPMEGLYWTLWLELHFYVLVALLVWWGITYSRCIGFMATWLLVGVFAQATDTEFLEALLITSWTPYFVTGMALYLIYTYGSNVVLWIFVAGGFALAGHWNFRLHPDLYGANGHGNKGVGIIILAGIFIAMILVATHKLDWIRWRPLTTLGALTYPLYLIHLTVFRPVVRSLYPDMNKWAVLAICVAVALASSYLIYRLVEQPLGRLLNQHLKSALRQIRELSKPQAKAAPAPAPAPVPPVSDAEQRPDQTHGTRDYSGRLTPSP